MHTPLRHNRDPFHESDLLCKTHLGCMATRKPPIVVDKARN